MASPDRPEDDAEAAAPASDEEDFDNADLAEEEPEGVGLNAFYALLLMMVGGLALIILIAWAAQ